MEIDKLNLLRINKGFGGNLRNDSSLEFAFSQLKNKKIGNYKKLAYLWRAILIDNSFSDGNKRTAAYISFEFAENNKKKVNRELLIHHIVSIAKKNITQIKNIERRIRNAIK